MAVTAMQIDADIVTADSNLISFDGLCRSLLTTAATLQTLVNVQSAQGGCGVNLGLVYAVSPRLSRYSRGLSEPREILIRFSLYQQM